jgi:hypothetical protein
MLWLTGIGEGFVAGCCLSALAGWRRRPRPAEANPKQSAEQTGSKVLTRPTPEADRLAALSDAELIQEAYERSTK